MSKSQFTLLSKYQFAIFWNTQQILELQKYSKESGRNFDFQISCYKNNIQDHIDQIKELEGEIIINSKKKL